MIDVAQNFGIAIFSELCLAKFSEKKIAKKTKLAQKTSTLNVAIAWRIIHATVPRRYLKGTVLEGGESCSRFRIKDITANISDGTSTAYNELPNPSLNDLYIIYFFMHVTTTVGFKRL